MTQKEKHSNQFTDIYGQLIFDKDIKISQGRNDGISYKLCWKINPYEKGYTSVPTSHYPQKSI